MNMEQLVEYALAEETDVLRNNLSQCNLVHNKSHVVGSWIKLVLLHGEQAVTNYKQNTNWHSAADQVIFTKLEVLDWDNVI
jgi:hypothetical protein